MDKLELLVIGHLVGVFIMVGVAGLSTTVGIVTARLQDVRTSAFLLDVQHRAEIYGTSAGAVITVLFGILLVNETGHEFSEGWLSAAFALIIAALAVDHGYLMPQNRKARRHAQQLLDSGTTQSGELPKSIGRPLPTGLGILLDVSFLAFLYLMVVRPGS